ncbi:MAG: hypothetical protein NT040_07485 [Bacteroidetes bacterium]|nr:hypothetical protein [Bacteroidota bacterium]
MDELNENEKPASWLDDLSELIRRKKAENELLKKLQGITGIPDDHQGDTGNPGAENKNEQEKES